MSDSGFPSSASSCSGTLIGPDLFLTARHCLTDPNGEDLRSSSVTFDYATACDGTRPAGHVTRFFKVLEEVATGAPPSATPFGSLQAGLRANQHLRFDPVVA